MPESYGTSSIQNVILIVLAVVVIAISIGSIYAFIRAILLFIFSQGKEDKIKTAWNSIRYMIMGIFLSVLLLFVFPLAFKRMGLENYEAYSAKNVFNKAGDLLGETFKIKDLIKESQQENQYRDKPYYDDDFKKKFYKDYSL